MAKKKTRSSPSNASHAAKAARGGKDVRKRVHELTLRAFRDHDLSLSELPGLAREVVHGAAAKLDAAVPKSGRNVLRQVFDGLTDAVAAAAKATKATASSAGERGAAVVRSDVRRTAKDLRQLEDEFLDSLHKSGRSLRGAAKEELEKAVSEARHAGTKIRTAAKDVREAADGRVVELGREAAGAGARAVRSAVGTILLGAGGLLEGLADTVTKPAPPKSRPAKARSTPAGKKTTRP